MELADLKNLKQEPRADKPEFIAACERIDGAIEMLTCICLEINSKINKLHPTPESVDDMDKTPVNPGLPTLYEHLIDKANRLSVLCDMYGRVAHELTRMVG